MDWQLVGLKIAHQYLLSLSKVLRREVPTKTKAKKARPGYNEIVAWRRYLRACKRMSKKGTYDVGEPFAWECLTEELSGCDPS